MLDRFNREINYLRVSITDRCNLRCEYCMPEDGVKLLRHSDILTFNEIIEIIRISVSFGIEKVRITGGEPLVRKNVVELVKMISQIPEIKDLGLTTNGVLLEKFAKPLKDAGLKRINISLDTLNVEKFAKITRGGNLLEVLKGIESAQKAGFSPIKINCVVEKDSQESDAKDVENFCAKNDLLVRFISKMNLKEGIFFPVEGGEGGKCGICNRLRLTSDGKIKPCLFSNLEFDVRKLGIEEAIKLAVENKPVSGNINNINEFHHLGG